MERDKLNLTGSWTGVFSYPRALPPNAFEAELRDHIGLLTGETFERANNPRDRCQPLHAMIEGQRHGHEVSFVKHYDAFRRATTPVHYAGRLSADGSEISGTWTIPGHWSGSFLMIRARPPAQEAERRVAEQLRS